MWHITGRLSSRRLARGLNLLAEDTADTGLVLSREDAQARALLGCDQEWVEGTADYWLAETIGREVC